MNNPKVGLAMLVIVVVLGGYILVKLLIRGSEAVMEQAGLRKAQKQEYMEKKGGRNPLWPFLGLIAGGLIGLPLIYLMEPWVIEAGEFVRLPGGEGSQNWLATFQEQDLQFVLLSSLIAAFLWHVITFVDARRHDDLRFLWIAFGGLVLAIAGIVAVVQTRHIEEGFISAALCNLLNGAVPYWVSTAGFTQSAHKYAPWGSTWLRHDVPPQRQPLRDDVPLQHQPVLIGPIVVIYLLAGVLQLIGSVLLLAAVSQSGSVPGARRWILWGVRGTADCITAWGTSKTLRWAWYANLAYCPVSIVAWLVGWFDLFWPILSVLIALYMLLPGTRRAFQVGRSG